MHTILFYLLHKWSEYLLADAKTQIYMNCLCVYVNMFAWNSYTKIYADKANKGVWENSYSYTYG
jgi:hypothetical protein